MGACFGKGPTISTNFNDETDLDTLLIYGYIRFLEKIYDILIPDGIYGEIELFCPQIHTYFTFDAITKNDLYKTRYILNDGKTFLNIVGDNCWCDFLTVSCCHGYQSGIHKFTMELKGETAIAIGIVGDHIHDTDQWIDHHDDTFYYLSARKGVIGTNNPNKGSRHRAKILKEAKKLSFTKNKSEYITMILDLDNFVLKYQVYNDTEINRHGGKTIQVRIAKNKTYYICVSILTNKSAFIDIVDEPI